jgi:hypothetical protein
MSRVEIAQALKDLRKNILGLHASTSVYWMIDEAIRDHEPGYMPPDNAHQRRKKVVDRNLLIEQLKAEVIALKKERKALLDDKNSEGYF